MYHLCSSIYESSAACSLSRLIFYGMDLTHNTHAFLPVIRNSQTLSGDAYLSGLCLDPDLFFLIF